MERIEFSSNANEVDREKPYTLRDCLMELEGQEFIITISFSEEGEHGR